MNRTADKDLNPVPGIHRPISVRCPHDAQRSVLPVFVEDDRVVCDCAPLSPESGYLRVVGGSGFSEDAEHGSDVGRRIARELDELPDDLRGRARAPRREIDQIDAVIRRLDVLRGDADLAEAELARRIGRAMRRWPEYAPSHMRYVPVSPLSAPGGIPAGGLDGAIGDKWWSKRFLELLETFLRTRVGPGREGHSCASVDARHSARG